MAGVGGNALDLAIVIEELSRVSTDFTMAFAGSIFCGLNILRNGTEAQKRYWLPRCCRARSSSPSAFPSPTPARTSARCKTFAQREGDKWIVNGQKLWTTGAGLKDSVISVYVRTDRDAHYRNGLSLFLIDNDTPGIELRKLEMLGRRCVGTYEVFFRDVEVPHDRLVGGENKGWDCLMSGLQYERAVSAAGSTRRRAGHRRSRRLLRPGARAVRPADRQLPGDRPLPWPISRPSSTPRAC